MRTIDDYIEYLTLGSIALLIVTYSAYIISPLAILPIVEWLFNDIVRLIPLLPLIFALGLIAHRMAITFNNRLLHRPLLKKEQKDYEGLRVLANQVRCIKSNSIGRTLEWGWHLIFHYGSEELRKQNLRVFYAYRICYGTMFLLFVPLIASLAGLFMPHVDKNICLYTIIGCALLLVLTYISTISTAKNFWRNIYYSTQILLETHPELFETHIARENKKKISKPLPAKAKS